MTAKMTVREKMVKFLDRTGVASAKEIAKETNSNYNSVRRELQWDTFGYFSEDEDGHWLYCLAKPT